MSCRFDPLKIALMHPSKIVPYARNPRKNQAAIANVAASIKEFGFRQPIVVDTDGVIIWPHPLQGRQKLGLEKVPVHVAKDLTPEQIKAYRIADNRPTWPGGIRVAADRVVGTSGHGLRPRAVGFRRTSWRKLLDPGAKG